MIHNDPSGSRLMLARPPIPSKSVICDDDAILNMSDFVISYRPKSACVISKDIFYVDRTNLGRRNPGNKPNTVKSVYRLVQWLKTRGNHPRFA